MSNGKKVERRGWIRLLVRWLVRLYYSRIEITDAERIGQTGPVLICANHQNSLLDPIILGMACRRPLRFMAKAPLFKSPVLGPIMEALGMIPTFRGSDDASQVRRNLESLDVGAKILVEGHAMGIFPEGKSTDQAHLEMVRSGAARMAIQAVEEGAQGLKIVPIGLNYQRKEEFRSSIWVRVGDPIDVEDWLQKHEGNPRQARRALTSEIEVRLKEVVVHLDEPKWEPWLDDLEILAPRQSAPDKSEGDQAEQAPVASGDQPKATPKKLVGSYVEALHRRKRIADAMNHFLATDRTCAEDVAHEIEAYRSQVHQARLSVESPVLQRRGLVVGLILLWRLLWLAVFAIPALLATVHHIVPFRVVRRISSRLQPPGKMTTSFYRLATGIPVYCLWYGIVAWWMFDYDFAWFAWTWLLSMPFFGLIALSYWRRAGRTSRLAWHQILCIFRRRKLKALREQQAALRDRLEELSRRYATVAPPTEQLARPPALRKFVRASIYGLAAATLFFAFWFASPWLFEPSLGLGEGPDLKRLSRRQLLAQFESDEKSLVAILGGLKELEIRAAEVQKDFDDGKRSMQVDEDNNEIQRLLVTFLNYHKGLLRLLWKYQRHKELDDRRLKLRGFLLQLTAAAALYDSSLKFVYGFKDDEKTVAKLNVEVKAWDIPQGTYNAIKRNLASEKIINRLNAARSYYHKLDEELTKYHLKNSEPYDPFHTVIEQSEKTAQGLGDPMWLRKLEVAAEDLEHLASTMHYETQSVVATWVGDIKIREPHDGKPLISPENVEKLKEKLQPGDILIERRNWYLSNAFLPGFWPHAAIYVGTAEELKKLGLDQHEHVKRHWDKFIKPDHEGHKHVIIEAISEGVLFSSLEHSIGGGDAAAVLRPIVSEEQKKDAIARAFNQVGKPYDFEFDFTTPDELVCTEVVFRTYGSNAQGSTLRFPTVEILGRKTMPAIELVRKYIEEKGTPEAQLQFVAFIDGDEKTGTSSFRDEAAFVETLNRPALTFLLGRKRDTLKSIGPVGWILLCSTVLGLLEAAISKLVSSRRKSAR